MLPILQLAGALFTGNKVLLKTDERAAVLMEHFLRLLGHCGAPSDSYDLLHCTGPEFERVLLANKQLLRMVHFTGSSKTALKLTKLMDGKVRFEDSGFNWKIIGPDVKPADIPYIVSQCEQDCYAAGG